jgi:glycosyltransferase involved in cell wall biosynthesis
MICSPDRVWYIIISLMTKILLVANTDWYLYKFRISLARYLRKKGFEVVLVSPGGRFVPQLQESGFRWQEWKLGRSTVSPWGELASFWQLQGIYRREKPLLVHHFTVKPVLYGSMAAKLCGVPQVVNSITGLGYIFEGKGTKARWIKPVARPLYRMALSWVNSENVFENTSDMRFFISNGFSSEQHAHLIESVGVDTDYFSPYPEPEGTPVVVMASRMLWDKGVGVLVDAARLLKNKIALRIALVGEPDPGNPSNIEMNVLQGWVKEGIVEWWGWQADMRTTYASCHIVTLPSLHEGSATGLLEAAAAGRPLVATDIPGCRIFVRNGENGLLVPVNDPVSLAGALEKLALNPELRQKMGLEGRKLVLANYKDEKINSATWQVYTKTGIQDMVV